MSDIKNLIKQGIDNCDMVSRYEHPGYEDGLCAGLRTLKGGGEPCKRCKSCSLYYGYEEDENE